MSSWRGAVVAAFVRIALTAPITMAAAAAPGVLEIEHIESGGFRVDGLRMEFDLVDSDAVALRLTISEATLPGGLDKLTGLSLVCPAVVMTRREISCPRGVLNFVSREGQQRIDLRGSYHARERRFELDVPRTDATAAALELAFTLGRAVSALEIHGQAIPVPLLAPYLRAAFEHSADFELADGRLDFRLRLVGGEGQSVSGVVTIADLALSNDSGRIASEDLAMQLEFDAARGSPSAPWEGSISMAFERGGIYAEPVYLDLGQHPLAFSSAFRYLPAAEELALTNFTIHHSGVAELTGNFASSSAHRIEHLEIDAAAVKFPAAYESWLSGVMVGTALAKLETAGDASGSFAIERDVAQRLRVRFAALDIEDRGGRFALYGLSGDINWNRAGADLSASEVEIAGGFFYGAGFGATRLELGIAGAAIDLLETARIPLLGGALAIKTFTVRDYAGDDLALGLEAELEPIDLGQLTLALNWPAFSGKLSGHLPLLTYKKGVVTVGGNLEARAFDGDISVEELRIEQPLGIVPAISANIRLRNLDLEQVTEVVPFGRVSGRLDGDIDGLRLLKGEPVTFNARFRTPANDESSHRLSQRAVDTISRVAGGGAVLSTTFLRVFKNFAYDALGISCRLENDICHMDGVAPADEGYYIVKGALLPRVDLIGRVRKVQWSRLMDQLEQALNEGQFKVE